MKDFKKNKIAKNRGITLMALIVTIKMKEGKQMKDFKKNKIAKNRGITLMALIVTIIVLLILAGISLHMLRR